MSVGVLASSDDGISLRRRGRGFVSNVHGSPLISQNRPIVKVSHQSELGEQNIHGGLTAITHADLRVRQTSHGRSFRLLDSLELPWRVSSLIVRRPFSPDIVGRSILRQQERREVRTISELADHQEWDNAFIRGNYPAVSR